MLDGNPIILEIQRIIIFLIKIIETTNLNCVPISQNF